MRSRKSLLIGVLRLHLNGDSGRVIGPDGLSLAKLLSKLLARALNSPAKRGSLSPGVNESKILEQRRIDGTEH